MKYNILDNNKFPNYKIDFYPIYNFIKLNNLTIKSFCKNCNITISEFYKIKKQDYSFRFRSIIKISFYTKIELQHLITNLQNQKIQTIFTL